MLAIVSRSPPFCFAIKMRACPCSMYLSNLRQRGLLSLRCIFSNPGYISRSIVFRQLSSGSFDCSTRSCRWYARLALRNGVRSRSRFSSESVNVLNDHCPLEMNVVFPKNSPGVFIHREWPFRTLSRRFPNSVSIFPRIF